MIGMRAPTRLDAYRHRRALRRRLPIRLALATLAALVLGGLTLAISRDWVPVDRLFPIRGIDVSILGARALSEGDIVRALAIAEDASFLGFDWSEACRRVQALPRVRRVRLRYRPLHRLDVTVEERSGAALVLSPAGEAWEVSGDGVWLEPRGATLADLPLLSWEGPPAHEMLRAGAPVTIPGASDLLDVLATLQGDFPGLWESISEARLRADGTYELFLNDLEIVVWGQGRLSSVRFRAWRDVMADLRRRGETDAVVDLRFREQVLVRLPEPIDLG